MVHNTSIFQIYQRCDDVWDKCTGQKPSSMGSVPIRSVCISVEMFEETKAGQAVGGLELPPVKVGMVEETWLDKSGVRVVLLNVSFCRRINRNEDT